MDCFSRSSSQFRFFFVLNGNSAPWIFFSIFGYHLLLHEYFQIEYGKPEEIATKKFVPIHTQTQTPNPLHTMLKLKYGMMILQLVRGWKKGTHDMRTNK